MQNKVIVIKELKTGTTKKEPVKNYPIVIDQDGEQWAIWNQSCPLDLNKVYLFRFEVNDKGYNDIRQIEPLVNIFKAKVAQEMASKSEIKRDLFMSLSYSKDLLSSDKLPIDQLFTYSDTIYNYISSKAEGLMPKDN